MKVATVIVPDGYKDAKEFAADCGFALVDLDVLKMQKVLHDLDRKGGLGYEAHNAIREAIGKLPI